VKVVLAVLGRAKEIRTKSHDFILVNLIRDSRGQHITLRSTTIYYPMKLSGDHRAKTEEYELLVYSFHVQYISPRCLHLVRTDWWRGVMLLAIEWRSNQRAFISMS
jgi:hypothetical protein